MTQIEKLYTQLVASRSSFRFRDFQRILEAFDFTLERVNGSHHVYRHPAASRPLSIQPRGNLAKRYQVDQFLDIVEEFGLKIGK